MGERGREGGGREERMEGERSVKEEDTGTAAQTSTL